MVTIHFYGVKLISNTVRVPTKFAFYANNSSYLSDWAGKPQPGTELTL